MPEAVSMMGRLFRDNKYHTRKSGNTFIFQLRFSPATPQCNGSWFTLSARLFLSNRCAIRELKSRRDILPADPRYTVSPESFGRKLVSRGGFNQIQRSIKRDTSPCGQSHPRIPGGLHWLISHGAQKRNRVRASAPVQILISHSLTTDQLLSRKETSSTPFSGSQIG